MRSNAISTQRYVKKDVFVQKEGDIGVHTEKIYSIACKLIVPKERECNNLFVPVCLSSTRIAFGRSGLMILGQSAATAAVLGTQHNLMSQQLPYATLEKALLADSRE